MIEATDVLSCVGAITKTVFLFLQHIKEYKINFFLKVQSIVYLEYNKEML